VKSLFRLILVLAMLGLSHSALAQALLQIPPDLSAPQARQLQEAGQLLVLDVRTPQEWRQTGVAEGAARLNMRHPGGGAGFIEDLLSQVDGDRNAPIGLICRTGNRTTQLQRFLLAQGFTQVYNVKEGMAGSAAGPGWLRHGLPVDPCRSC
jgi:rhodanese-related sulfurtransferase